MRARTLCIATIAAGLVACDNSSKGTSNAGATGGTVVIESIGDPSDLLPPFVADAAGTAIQGLVFDRLADIGSNLSTVGDKGFTPRLAKSWTWAPDSLSITFSLDPRARWHDGQPVTASDVRYSLRAFQDPKVGSPTAPNIANLDSVAVRDSLTAVMYFKKHTPEQFFDVAYQLFILPEHVYGKVPFDQLHTSDVSRTLIGSGQFRVVHWEPKVRIELVADTANYHGRAKLDRVIFTPTSDANAGTAAILSGQADFMQTWPMDQVGKLDSSTVAGPIAAPNFGYGFLGFNRFQRKSKTVPNPIFSDIRVRRAFAMAIDRQAMVKNVFGKFAIVSHGPFSMQLSVADSAVKLPPYDTTAAKALLDSAGWKVGADGMRAKNGKPLRFGILYPSTSLLRKQYAVLLQEAFKKVGAQVDLDQVDGQTFQARALASDDFDAALNAFNSDPSVRGSVQNWGTSGIGGQNFLMYSNPKVDAQFDSSLTTFDPAKEKTHAVAAFQAIANDVPAVFLYDLAIVAAAHRRLNIPALRADNWAATIPEWSIPADKRIDRDKIGLAPAKP